VFKIERKIQLRWVVGRVRAAEVEKLIKLTYPEVEKGDKSYPGHYQKCLSTYVKSLGKEEKAAFEGERVKWQQEGPPMELRTRCVSLKRAANLGLTSK
jgi:hypothetical protein